MPVGRQDVRGERCERGEVVAALSRSGSAAADRLGGRRPYALAREREWLLARIAEKPDLTLRALRLELAERGMVVSYFAVWHFLRHERDYVQKKACTQPSRIGPTSARRRERWKTHQGKLDPARLVFIDETWAKTNMTRRHGRCAPRATARRQGRHLARWRTLTFLAALRCDRIDCALCHRRTDQRQQLPRLCRADPGPDACARRHRHHG